MADIIGGKPGSGFEVEERILTLAEVTNGELQLVTIPDPTKVVIHVPCGTTQVSTADYIVAGDKINWSGRGLETIMSEGDILIITYGKL